tara:strand:+ start:112 stop:927 length:816 start_codon:yes stop_codon:yes gene_type:complete
MNGVLKKIENLEIALEDISKIKEGETSDTFIGNYNNKKIILKVYKDSKLKNERNDFLNANLIRQLSDLKLFPKIIYISEKNDFFIYEYFKSISYEADINFIKKLGNKLKEVHRTKPIVKIDTFFDQIRKYEIELERENLKNIFKNIYLLLNQTNKENNKLVLSHNDLIKNNILINKDICFIDYEYASLNNIHCDLARVIDEFNLKNDDIKHLLNSYDYGDKTNMKNNIEIWKKINLYLDYIWILTMQKRGNLKQDSKKHLKYSEKIKLLEQ